MDEIYDEKAAKVFGIEEGQIVIMIPFRILEDVDIRYVQIILELWIKPKGIQHKSS